MLEDNPIANAISFHNVMVAIALTNGLLLTIFIVDGWRKQTVYTWTWCLTAASRRHEVHEPRHHGIFIAATSKLYFSG